MEGQIAESHDELEREKKLKADLDKARRKLEGELKTSQEQIDLLGHSKDELDKTLARFICYYNVTYELILLLIIKIVISFPVSAPTLQ